jgi:hypothetical protein
MGYASHGRVNGQIDQIEDWQCDRPADNPYGYHAAMESDAPGAPPNCERCLVPMLVDGSTESPFWRCPSCDLVRLV